MGIVKFDRVRPDDLIKRGKNLYLRYNDTWVCLSNSCKLLMDFVVDDGFKYIDFDDNLHHFYIYEINKGMAYYEKDESYETVSKDNSSMTYIFTEEDMVKYSKDLYDSSDIIRTQLDELNYSAELFSNNPYTNKRRVN